MMDTEIMKNMSASLSIMWKGMLGLFIVCGFVALLMMLITKIIGKPKK
jgi:hypothetical protein